MAAQINANQLSNISFIVPADLLPLEAVHYRSLWLWSFKEVSLEFLEFSAVQSTP